MVALLLLTMAGCGEDSAAAPDPAALRGEAWVLSSGIDVEGWEQVAPSATFTRRRSAALRAATASTPPTRSTAASSAGAGRGHGDGLSGPRGAVEEAFRAALAQVTAWRMDGDQLVLLDDDGGELLRFAPASVAGAWTVTAFRQPGSVSSPIVGTELTATFGADGKLSGNAGCNPYTTTYRAQRGTIEIAAPGSGRMACATPKGVDGAGARLPGTRCRRPRSTRSTART